MKVRTRDFIHTKDDLFFACTNYSHPEDRIISFLRYIPDENGDREKDGKKYSKVDSTQAYEYLSQNYPEYLYFCDVTNIQMMGPTLDKINKIIRPNERLSEIINEFNNNNYNNIINNNYNKNKNVSSFKNISLIKKLIKISSFFNQVANIPLENLGISGSILPGLEKEGVSDIDFVIYGLENHKKAVEAFKNNKGKEIIIDIMNKKTNIKLEPIQDEFWNRLYEKRLKDLSLSKTEFSWYENRKNNRGVIDGTLFDILATRNWDEINEVWGTITYEKVGEATIEAKVKSALGAFDNPASYDIENLKIINGDTFDIIIIVSFTHTYSGQALDGEEIIAKGKVERVIDNNSNSIGKNKGNNKANSKNNSQNKNSQNASYRLVIGTTRESIDEFIKLKNISI